MDIIDKIKKSEHESVEEYLLFYMKQTGLGIDDIMMVRKFDPGTFTFNFYATQKEDFMKEWKETKNES